LLPDSGKHVQGPLGLPVYIRVATPFGYTLPAMGGRVRLSARHRSEPKELSLSDHFVTTLWE